MNPAQRYTQLVATGKLSGDPAQARVVEALAGLSAALDTWAASRRRSFLPFRKASPPPRGMYIHGPVGRGKSMLMDLFHETARIEPRRRVHFHDFMAEVHKAVKLFRDKEPGDPIPKVAEDISRRANLLCFDEFQVSDIADAMILYRLFAELFERNVVIVATSNRIPADLYENGINRQLFLPAIALIEKQMTIVHLGGPIDYRLARLERSAVWFHPLSADAASALDNLWLDLTGVHEGTPDSIEVMGRKLEIPEQARGVARFTFDGLCRTAMGPQDYLAIADRYHAVVVSGIPRMKPQHRNEAKRFVTLIDALYDRAVKLLATAEAAPAELYPAGDGAFEFERTVSRLIEMQSADYLARSHKPLHESPP
jgi:cell division protein ZapE